MTQAARRSGAAPAAPLLAFPLALALLLLGGQPDAGAAKLRPTVTAAFEGAPERVALGAPIHLLLRLTALEDAPDTTVEVLVPDGMRVLGGAESWTGSMPRGGEVRLWLTVEVTGPGEYSLGARLTTRRDGALEVSGAVLNARASDASVDLGQEPLGLMAMRAAGDVAELRRLGVALTAPAPPTLRSSSPARAAAAPAAPETRVTGRVRWRDPEGGAHPARRAHVEILEATSRAPLAWTSTDDAGVYEAGVTAGSVIVAAYSRDAEGKRVEVAPPDAPSERYVLESEVVSLVGPQVVIDVTSAATVRGAPGAPSMDSLSARAFAVYDAMLTFWFQAAALVGRDVQRAHVSFPAPTRAGCGTTCYVAQTPEIFVLREDAFDWDVLGHEFFHFVADLAAPRAIDRNPGGGHSGGTAIGQPPRPGAPGRTRDEGMRLAWSEGLATFMSLALQAEPPDPTFDFPRSLASVGDRRYQDREDIEIVLDPEGPAASEGFGSASSVLGLLWDLFDAAADGGDTDTVRGVGPRLVWSLITRDLPCDPCDRVDRVWTAVTRFLGARDSRTLEVARAFALNRIAPEAVAPAEGAVASVVVPPTFAWVPNGDPSPAHRPNRFLLALSRDGFRNHLAVIEVPALDATSYTPTQAEWASVLAGGPAGAGYEWLVAGLRQDDPAVPEGWYWYSNVLRFRLGG